MGYVGWYAHIHIIATAIAALDSHIQWIQTLLLAQSVSISVGIFWRILCVKFKMRRQSIAVWAVGLIVVFIQVMCPIIIIGDPKWIKIEFQNFKFPFQTQRIGCDTTTETVPAAQLTQTDSEFVAKYSPKLWETMKTANARDVHLLRMKKLEAPAHRLYVTTCIEKYVLAIKPMVNEFLNKPLDRCTLRLALDYRTILDIASFEGFQCLHSYHIAINNVHADPPPVRIPIPNPIVNEVMA